MCCTATGYKQAPNSVPCNKWFNSSAISVKFGWIEIKYFILNWRFSTSSERYLLLTPVFFQEMHRISLKSDTRALSAFLMCGLLFFVCSTHEHTLFSSHIDLSCWKNPFSTSSAFNIGLCSNGGTAALPLRYGFQI